MLKYYVYISATKVGMLYPQIPPAFLKGAEAELKINLGVISTGFKAHGPEEAKELPRQVAAVEAYLRDKGLVGTAEDPHAWISGSALMRWGRVRDYAAGIAFFGGTVGHKTVALLGSSDSIIGMPLQADSNHSLDYYTLRSLESELRRASEAADWSPPASEFYSPFSSYARSVDLAYQSLKDSDANLEFLALVLEKRETLIVATPLYVALAS
jgi:hypothetical protein